MGSPARFRKAATVVVAIALVAPACGSDPGTTADGPQDAASLTVAIPRDLGPINIFAGATDQLAGLVYDKLFAPSPYVDEPQPWLATEVRGIDPTTWEVDIREDVTWHDGEPFTTEDVAYSFDYMHQAPTGRFTHHVNNTPDITSVEVVSDRTVRFTCSYACPSLAAVTLADLPIVPQHIWSEIPADQAKTHAGLPIGTGPFQLVDYSPTTGYRFEANDDYFAGEPVVDELVMPVITDQSATFTALRTGEIDSTTRPLPPELAEQFTADPALGVVKTAPLQFPEIRMNYERAPFDIPEFRRALSRAVDKEQMLEVVALDRGRAATKGYPHPDAPFANPANSTPYDLDEANTLLDELGFSDTDGDGIRESADGPLEFTVLVDGALPQDVRAAEIVAEDFAAIGVRVTPQGIDAGSITELFRSREFDLYINTITAHGVADPDQFIMSHRSGYLWKAPDLPYPEWDAIYERWRAADTHDDRLAVMGEMQELFNRQPTSIPLYYPDESWAYRADTFNGWAESPGYGIIHKWSFLPASVADGANAVVRTGR
ncbi:ABC transporter substrate-binding protein [Hoyosella sp. G463]|uniref:ABC transporter substrate-binding protein n=1 Tax=Lolliginicoccus lacisalsi TaxID=2742202 RepID=A0A927J9U9_9ACTN|nr:ABC transporter substrate-binding protein [Lolliginicoccus lacisalsi]MBD8505156.1 ABC transporter substrate-binding protein [Lolliginicoccus lacisalsi]